MTDHAAVDSDEMLALKEHLLDCEGVIKRVKDENNRLREQNARDSKELSRLRRYYEIKEGWIKRNKRWWQFWI